MAWLTMKDGNGRELSVEIDDTSTLGFGGFGRIHPVIDDPAHVVKRIELDPPQPVGNIPGYVAHIRTTRSRLLEIRYEEQERAQPRAFIIEAIDEIVEQALSTHWAFDPSGLQITAVWFRQRRAPGRPLSELFRDAPPPVASRQRIARNLLTRMRTLRRADLVHLDCVPDNIFVDQENVTLIDLDGSGIVRRSAPTRSGPNDEWDHRPLTLGHLKSVRPPPWYPQVGLELGPRMGNYLFAERWVVLDTVIRILTWNRFSALSWLDPGQRKPIVDGYWLIKQCMEDAKSEGTAYTGSAWVRLHQAHLVNLRRRVGSLPDPSFPPNNPQCLKEFAELVNMACFDPSTLGSTGGSPYELYRNLLR